MKSQRERDLENEVVGLRADLALKQDEIDQAHRAVDRCEAQISVVEEAHRTMTAVLMTCSVFRDMPTLPLLEAITQLVRDHEELEMRIEAVLVMHPKPCGVLSSIEHHLPRDEVHRLLRGGTRIPDDISSIEGPNPPPLEGPT